MPVNDKENDEPLRPARLLQDNIELLAHEAVPGPVLDLASGRGHNGIFLALRGLEVTCCDRSQEALEHAEAKAKALGVPLDIRLMDLEAHDCPNDNPLPEDHYGAILVFRYLHRPLMPCIRKAIKTGGLLMYETFTKDQRRFGRPHNPNFLLKAGELRGYFNDWEILHYFEGILEDPSRAMARLICKKPSGFRR